MNEITIFDLHKSMRNNFYDKRPEKHISIDEGWYKLVLQCHIELLNVDPQYKIYQIKEKFGELRYYYEPSEHYWEDYQIVSLMTRISSKYEAISKTTCEATGQVGVLMKSPTGYFRTLNPQWASQHSFFNKYVVVNS